MDKDITKGVKHGYVDNGMMPLYECVCGKKFQSWDFILNEGGAGWGCRNAKCSGCGREMYFTHEIVVWEVVP